MRINDPLADDLVLMGVGSSDREIVRCGSYLVF
jgi:hypothetical protein